MIPVFLISLLELISPFGDSIVEKSPVVLGHDASFKGLVAREHCQKITSILGQAKITRKCFSKRDISGTGQAKLKTFLEWRFCVWDSTKRDSNLRWSTLFGSNTKQNDLLTQLFKLGCRGVFLNQQCVVLSRFYLLVCLSHDWSVSREKIIEKNLTICLFAEKVLACHFFCSLNYLFHHSIGPVAALALVVWSQNPRCSVRRLKANSFNFGQWNIDFNCQKNCYRASLACWSGTFLTPCSHARSSVITSWPSDVSTRKVATLKCLHDSGSTNRETKSCCFNQGTASCNAGGLKSWNYTGCVASLQHQRAFELNDNHILKLSKMQQAPTTSNPAFLDDRRLGTWQEKAWTINKAMRNSKANLPNLCL